ncbi:uncharacterized protein E0L32_004848 [Thyridium curvatum]|uniref:Diaminohydroxyphosphoribosylamino-pyrimidine deaminase n=1 Tax=Thyridium curvatum TaxID=1093900 RepID=A0A507BE10_9PEZI|nr:uncharacterized protein E0L32_004848 [Thyridium curvatum]TPX15018.1 hypothetical protein E0L32_004848 [Thyridium curvatum]
MNPDTLTQHLGSEIDDPDEETFVLFSQDIPSGNLGFIDPRASALDLTIAGRDLTIHQSPAVLSSNRPGGTTGAVVWKVTPVFAEWVSSPANLLFRTGALSRRSAVLELGCGISAVVGLALAPSVSTYVLTDQAYVARLVEQNIEENRGACFPPLPPLSSKKTASASSSSSSSKSRARPARQQQHAAAAASSSFSSSLLGDRIRFVPLDWETDEVTAAALLSPSADQTSFDAVIACDCIYNEALIAPLVQTCVDGCRLRRPPGRNEEEEEEEDAGGPPTVCIVAQQLRDSGVFEAWIRHFHEAFRVWRVPDAELPDRLGPGSGFVVHIGILRDT